MLRGSEGGLSRPPYTGRSKIEPRAPPHIPYLEQGGGGDSGGIRTLGWRFGIASRFKITRRLWYRRRHIVEGCSPCVGVPRQLAVAEASQSMFVFRDGEPQAFASILYHILLHFRAKSCGVLRCVRGSKMPPFPAPESRVWGTWVKPQTRSPFTDFILQTGPKSPKSVLKHHKVVFFRQGVPKPHCEMVVTLAKRRIGPN